MTKSFSELFHQTTFSFNYIMLFLIVVFPTQEDVFYFVQIKKVDEKLVNLARWWRNIASYENEFASLPGEPKLPGAAGEFLMHACYCRPKI